MPIRIDELAEKLYRAVAHLEMLAERIARIEQRQERIVSQVSGNGEPGHGEQIRALQDDVKALHVDLALLKEVHAAYASEHIKGRWSFRTELIRAAVTLLTGAGGAFAVVKLLLS